MHYHYCTVLLSLTDRSSYQVCIWPVISPAELWNKRTRTSSNLPEKNDIYSCYISHTDIGCPVIEVSSNGPNRVDVSHLLTERDPIPETLCCLEYQMMDKFQKPGNPKCYAPSSEPCRIYRLSWLRISWFFSLPPGKCRCNVFRLDQNCSFRIPYFSSFTILSWGRAVA
jgi:hypothetical protein